MVDNGKSAGKPKGARDLRTILQETLVGKGRWECAKTGERERAGQVSEDRANHIKGAKVKRGDPKSREERKRRSKKKLKNQNLSRGRRRTFQKKRGLEQTLEEKPPT